VARNLIFALAIFACLFVGLACLADDLGPALDNRFADDPAPGSGNQGLLMIEACARPTPAVRIGLPQRASRCRTAAGPPRQVRSAASPWAVAPPGHATFPARC
jgi:hypothetical protein